MPIRWGSAEAGDSIHQLLLGGFEVAYGWRYSQRILGTWNLGDGANGCALYERDGGGSRREWTSMTGTGNPSASINMIRKLRQQSRGVQGNVSTIR